MQSGPHPSSPSPPPVRLDKPSLVIIIIDFLPSTSHYPHTPSSRECSVSIIPIPSYPLDTFPKHHSTSILPHPSHIPNITHIDVSVWWYPNHPQHLSPTRPIPSKTFPRPPQPDQDPTQSHPNRLTLSIQPLRNRYTISTLYWNFHLLLLL